MPSVNQVLKAGLWQSITLAITIALRYGTIFVMAAFVEPAEWAIAALASVVVNLANSFSDAGFGPALVQRPEISPLHKRVAVTGSVLIGVALFLFLFLAAPMIEKFYGITELAVALRWIALVFIIQSFGLVSASLLRRELRFKRIMVIELASLSFAYAIPGIAMAVWGFGCYAFIYATLSYTTAYALLTFLAAVHNPLPSLHWESLKDLGRFSAGITTSRASNFAATNIDKLILSKLLSEYHFGLYDMAFRILMIPVKNIGKFADDYVFAFLCRLSSSREKLEGFKIALNLTSLISFPLTVFLVAISQNLVSTFLNAKWVETGPILSILMVSLYFRLMIRVSDSSLRALGAVFQDARNKLFFAGLVVAACSLTAWTGSVAQACWGIVLAACITSVTLILLNAKLLEVSVKDVVRFAFAGLPLAIVTAGACLGAAYVENYLQTSATPNLIIHSVIVLMVTTTATIVFPKIVGKENARIFAVVIQHVADSRPKLRPIIDRLFSRYKTETSY